MVQLQSCYRDLGFWHKLHKLHFAAPDVHGCATFLDCCDRLVAASLDWSRVVVRARVPFGVVLLSLVTVCSMRLFAFLLPACILLGVTFSASIFLCHVQSYDLARELVSLCVIQLCIHAIVPPSSRTHAAGSPRRFFFALRMFNAKIGIFNMTITFSSEVPVLGGVFRRVCYAPPGNLTSPRASTCNCWCPYQ